MNGQMPFWTNPALMILAAFGAICAILLPVFAIQRAIERRRRPMAPLPPPNPLPPGDTAIDQIRREIDESEQRSLHAEWVRDGEIVLAKKKP